MDAKYPSAIRILHWLMALFVIGLLAVGLYMTSLPRDNPTRDTLFALHKSFGVIVLLLCLLRIGLRLKSGIPALPEIIPALEKKLAHLSHYALYLLMLVMPLSGYLMTNSFGFPVKLFGMELPKLIGPDKDFGHMLDKVHEVGGYTLIGLITLHLAGVVKHRVVEHVNLLQRMV